MNNSLTIVEILEKEMDRLRAALTWYAGASDHDKSLDCGERATKALDPLTGKMCVTTEEGGEWIKFEKNVMGVKKDYNAVHAIRFEDGTIWDCINGWRNERT